MTMARCAVCGTGMVMAGMALICLAGAGAVRAQQEQPTAGEVFSEFLACDALAMPADRLICYETALKVMKRRFGLSDGRDTSVDFAPLLRPRRGEAPSETPAVRSMGAPSSLVAEDNSGKRFEATIVSATTDQVGHWIFTLDNGQVWKAMDGTWLKHTNYEGMTVIAKRGWTGGWRFKIKEHKEVGRFKRIR